VISLDFKDKNILITGISGFVGSRMARVLIDRGANVSGLLRRRSDGKIPNNMSRLGLGKEVRLVEGDLESIASIGSAITAKRTGCYIPSGCPIICAAIIRRSQRDHALQQLGTSNLLEAVRVKDVDPVVVFAGSSEEYGLVLSSEEQYKKAIEKYARYFPHRNACRKFPPPRRTPSGRCRPMQ